MVMMMDWASEAACKGQPGEWWFPSFPVRRDEREGIRLAVRVCSDCVVRVACLDHSLVWEPAGIWGGVTERERSVLRRRAGIVLRHSSDVVEPVRVRRRRGIINE